MPERVCAKCGAAEAPSGGNAACGACGGPWVLHTVAPEAAADAPLSPGTPFGKYVLQRELGRGSMGVVYEAQDSTLHRRVAIKILRASRTPDPKEAMHDWQRFLKEARLTANLAKHPNLVTIFDAGVHEGHRYIVMEHIGGEPFQRWRAGRSVREQIRILRDVALAMHHAHEHGIIHRDLKPGNVIVEAGGRPVVTDFGLATYERRGGAASLTPSGWVVGSPGYMSPEQARGQREIDRTTDVYALGVMLYEIAAGCPAFTGKNPVETLSKVVEGVKLPPSKAAPSSLADAVLDRICMKTMSLNAHDRHATALAFANDLGAWLGDAPAGGKTGFLRARAAIALLGLAGILFWFNARTNRAEREREALLKEVQGIREAAARPAPRPGLQVPLPVPLESFHQQGANPHNRLEASGLLFSTPCLFESAVEIPETGPYEITVTASCRPARNEFARFRLLVNGKPRGERSLEAEDPRDFVLKTDCPAGRTILGIEFLNDLYDEKTGEDRNLKVHRVSLKLAL